MRLNDKLTLMNKTTLPDGYGGEIVTDGPLDSMAAVVSVKENELKARSNGLGYDRRVSIIVDSDVDIEIGSRISYQGATYEIVESFPTHNNHFRGYKGFEV